MAIWEEILHEQKLLDGESDRGCILVGAVIVEQALCKLLARVFDGIPEKELFKFGQPLGSLSGKITTAFALSIITKTEYKDLHLVRRIRNDAAHMIGELGNAERSSFADSEVLARCRELSLAYYNGPETPARLGFVLTTTARSGTIEGLAIAWDDAAAKGLRKAGRLQALVDAAANRLPEPTASELAKLPLPSDKFGSKAERG